MNNHEYSEWFERVLLKIKAHLASTQDNAFLSLLGYFPRSKILQHELFENTCFYFNPLPPDIRPEIPHEECP